MAETLTRKQQSDIAVALRCAMRTMLREKEDMERDLRTMQWRLTTDPYPALPGHIRTLQTHVARAQQELDERTSLLETAAQFLE